MAVTRLLTAEDLWALPEAERGELIGGALLPVNPVGMQHKRVVGRLITRITTFAEPRGLGVAGPEGGYLLGRDPDTVLAPDVSLDRPEHAADDTPGFPAFGPLLAVEVVSPGDSRRELAAKVAVYLGAGVPLVWVVDPAERTVTVHEPDREPRLLSEADALDGGDVLPGFALPLADLFS